MITLVLVLIGSFAPNDLFYGVLGVNASLYSLALIMLWGIKNNQNMSAWVSEFQVNQSMDKKRVKQVRKVIQEQGHGSVKRTIEKLQSNEMKCMKGAYVACVCMFVFTFAMLWA